MSLRGWAGSLATAIGVSAGAGAAQLGLGYGLGIFSWLPTVHGVDEAAWLASLAWTSWIAALSVVLGAYTAARTGMSTVEFGPVTRVLWRVTLALAAGLGGSVVVALTAVPAQAAQRGDTFAPHLIVSGYAIAGVLLGMIAAGLVLSARAIGVNVLATGAWLWLLATVSVIDSLAAGRELGVAQLGVWWLTDSGSYWRSIHLPGAALAAGSALLIGALAAWPSARRGEHMVGIALSGVVGPAMVASAYLLAAPTLVDVRASQLSAHLSAPYAMITGLVGSVLVALFARPRRPKPAPVPAGPNPAINPSPASVDATDSPATSAAGRAKVPVPAAPADPPAAAAEPETADTKPIGAKPSGAKPTSVKPSGAKTSAAVGRQNAG